EDQRSSLPDLEQILTVPDAWRSRVTSATPFPRAPIDPFAPAAIAYTSGTTGFPKGAVHTQHNLVLIGAVHRAMGHLGESERHASPLPLTILNLMVLQPLLAFQMGACAICIEKVDAVMLAEWIRRERITHFSGVPTMIYDLLAKPEIRPEDVATL